MNYLTNYYKTLSEQLQEQVNHLENILIEAKKKMVVDKKTGRKVEVKKVVLKDVDPNNDSFVISQTKGKGAARERTGSLPMTGAFPQFGSSIEAQYVDAINSPRLEPENPISTSYGGGSPIEVDASQIRMDPREKGRNVKGAGKKRQKEEMARSAAETRKPYDQREEVPTTARNTRGEAVFAGGKERMRKVVLANAIKKAQAMEANKTNISNPVEYARLQALIKRM